MGDFVPAYVPGPVPFDINEIPRYLADELRRIGTTYSVPRLNYTILEDTALLVPLTALPAFGRLFDDPPIDSETDIPDSQFDQNTGVWTCVDDGIYDISCTASGTAPGAGNKQWLMQLRTTIAGGSRSTSSGNTDNLELSVSSSYIVPLGVGQTVFWDLGAVTDTPGGATTDVTAFGQIWRLI